MKFADSNKLRLRGRSLLRRIVRKAAPDTAMLRKPENTGKPDQIGPLANVREKLRSAARRLCQGSKRPCDTDIPGRRGSGGGATSHSPYNLRRRNSTKQVQFRT